MSALVHACLASFPARGAELTLYSYEPLPEAPRGVQIRDAREICADVGLRDRYFVNGEPSLATFSDRFRYEMLSTTNYCWIDADFLCLTLGSLPAADFVWGRQPEARGKALINNALLKLPHQHPVLEAMRARARAAEGKDIAWGEIGPFLLTDIAEQAGVDGAAEPPARFYPVAPDEFWRLLEPASNAVVSAAAETSTAVHLWSELLRRVGYDFDAAPPKGAYLHDQFAEIGALGRFKRVCDEKEVQALIERWRASRPDGSGD